MMAKDYVECFRVQRSRVNEIQIGLSQRNLDTDTHAQKLSQTHWNWMQMRFAEINQTVLSASLDTLTETNDQDSMFQNIRALLLSARPGLETEQPHLNTQVYFMMLLKVFNFFSYMSENSTSDGTELQEGLTTLLTQEAMAPNNSQDYYRSLLRSGLTQPNPSEYQPFSLSRNVSPSEVNFPLVTMRMQEGIFRSIASQSREAGQPKIFFCATDLFNSLGETENHFTQIVEHTRWAIRFNMQDHQIIFYVNEGDGVFKQYQIDSAPETWRRVYLWKIFS